MPVSVANNVAAIDAGTWNSFFLTTDGNLWGMGYNYEGELGTGTSDSRTTPILIAAVAPENLTTLPSDFTLQVGDGTTFTVTANAAPAFSCHWQISTDNGVTWADLYDDEHHVIYVGIDPDSGALTSTLEITAAITDMDGSQYRYLVENIFGSATSKTAVLHVTETGETAIPPWNLALLPDTQTVGVGITFSLAASANSISAPTYQWQVSTDNGNTWTALSDNANYTGAATAELTITAAGDMNGNRYRYIVQNSGGSTISNECALVVVKADFMPVVSMSGWVYGETPANPVVTNNLSGGDVTFYYDTSLTGSFSSTTCPTNAGDYYVKAVITTTAYYNAAATVPVAFTIAKASFIPVVSISGWTYGETPANPVVTNNLSGGAVTFYYDTSLTGSFSSTTHPTNAGDYYVKAVIAATTNYNATVSAPVGFTIKVASGYTDITEGNKKELKAWIQNGVLHVSGLTAGKTWSVYSLTGALLYRNVAATDVETVRALSLSRGVYIVQSENRKVKVEY